MLKSGCCCIDVYLIMILSTISSDCERCLRKLDCQQFHIMIWSESRLHPHKLAHLKLASIIRKIKQSDDYEQ